MYSCTPSSHETTQGNHKNETEMNSSALASLNLTSNTTNPHSLSVEIKVSKQQVGSSIISTKNKTKSAPLHECNWNKIIPDLNKVRIMYNCKINGWWRGGYKIHKTLNEYSFIQYVQLSCSSALTSGRPPDMTLFRNNAKIYNKNLLQWRVNWCQSQRNQTINILVY